MTKVEYLVFGTFDPADQYFGVVDIAENDVCDALETLRVCDITERQISEIKPGPRDKIYRVTVTIEEVQPE